MKEKIMKVTEIFEMDEFKELLIENIEDFVQQGRRDFNLILLKTLQDIGDEFDSSLAEIAHNPTSVINVSVYHQQVDPDLLIIFDIGLTNDNKVECIFFAYIEDPPIGRILDERDYDDIYVIFGDISKGSEYIAIPGLYKDVEYIDSGEQVIYVEVGDD